MEQPEYRVHKHHRRMSSTGGGRAWTEEEESYLLRTRMHKMPYKHIAAHLKKTELACRLHYHQMSYGNNGRRRSASISSTGSFGSISAGGDMTDNAHFTQLSPVVSPRSSPEPSQQRRVSSETSLLQSHRAPVPILPKPDTTHKPLPLEPSMDFIKSDEADNRRASSTYNHKEEQQSYINYSRLYAVYGTHSAAFWAKIAAEYSRDTQEVSAKAVEEAFIQNISRGLARAHFPPTPNASPEASPEPQQQRDSGLGSSPVMSRGFQAVNGPELERVAAATQHESTHRSMAERCSVSALLTVEREVRSSYR